MRIPFLEKSYIVNFEIDSNITNIIFKINRFKNNELLSISEQKIKKLFPNAKNIFIKDIKAI